MTNFSENKQMEQHQIKVSRSLGTKLLVSIALLLVLVIAFLNLSTILLLKEDKRAYIYESQSTEAVLAGKEFVTAARHAIDTLRVLLGGVNFAATSQLTANQISQLQSVIDNQSDISQFSIYLLNPTGARLSKPWTKPLVRITQKQGRGNLQPKLSPETLESLLRDSYAFMNLTEMGGPPVLGVVVADLKLKFNSAGMPVAIGAISLKSFVNELNGLNLTIATKNGNILLDTDPTVLYSKKTLEDDPLFKTAAAAKLSMGAQEYESQQESFLGSYTNPGMNLVVLTRTAWKKAMRAIYVLTGKFILLGFMAIGVGVVFAILFSKTLTAPIKTLYEATKEVSKGNFDLRLEQKGKDEIGALTVSFNAMAGKIRELIEESVRRTHLENELAIASTVQQTLIPPPSFKNERISIHSHYRSASECGGDWWGFFGTGNKMSIMIADATGHGLPSALITAAARSCFSVMHKLAQEDTEFSYSPSAMLSYANRVVYDAALGKIMMTFFIGVFDFETRTLTYSNAGHNPPWLFKKEGGAYTMKSLVAPGLRLGESRDANTFEEKTIAISSDDLFFLYTDGLLEGKDPSGEMYGKKRMRQMIEKLLTSGPQQVIDGLIADFMSHNGEKPLDDDVTVAAAVMRDA